MKKKYGHLGEDVLLVELEKGSHGLGLSLAGHKDRTKMAVFVCGINPSGAAYKNGNIKVGDEILEVRWITFILVYSHVSKFFTNRESSQLTVCF